MEEEKLASLFQTLSIAAPGDLASATVNHVKAEPRALSRLIPNLIEVVSRAS
jgi:hypothetical protein